MRRGVFTLLLAMAVVPAPRSGPIGATFTQDGVETGGTGAVEGQ